MTKLKDPEVDLRKVAFLFPGQGTQTVGMGRSFAGDSSLRFFEEADRALNFSLSKLCFEGPDKCLSCTENAQPAVLLIGYIAAKLLEERGILPDYVAGHSLGEYAALTYAGALDLSDGLRLARKRGELMSAAFPAGACGMMAVLGLDEMSVAEIAAEASRGNEIAEVANLNCPGQIVIGGHRAALERAHKIGKEKGASKMVYLEVEVPSHTSLMGSVRNEFNDILNTFDLRELRVPLVANVDASETDDIERIKASLVIQLTKPVRWEESMKRLITLGVDTFVEVGVGRVLSGLMRRIDRSVKMVNVSDMDSLDKACEVLAH